ncbi:hypothetical protein CBR_g54213 [Chara braunii]|uniref:DUF659 domain-containing protein n=1 Tax=Chara braunii TaxID=69332 RepID=A0A388K785_CHABU|nr:hypothetical protein CBR_g54213 [Chara braunii]|eukprot:GBG65920.1 hypothetical protein CBR_g54213 [Chara braunii]
MPNSNGNFLMECKLCGQGFQGSQTKAAQHFTIKNNCAKISVEQMAEIWNKIKYGFDPSHARKIVDFLKSRGLRDNRCGSGREPAGNEEFEDNEEERRAVEGGDDDGESDAEDMEERREVECARGKLRKEKAVEEDSTPDEDADNDDDDEGADLGASLDGELMGDGRRGQEGAARAMKEAEGLKKRKRKAKMTTTEARSAPSQLKKSRWWYVSGISFEVARRPEYQRMRKKLLECLSYAHPALPTHRVISCEGIPQQQRVVADMVAAIRRDIEATGATILTDGRKSITSDHIVNFLAASPTGTYLFSTVQRDGAVQETTEAVVERWKDVFDKLSVDKVNAICTDSASAYVAACHHIIWHPHHFQPALARGNWVMATKEEGEWQFCLHRRMSQSKFVTHAFNPIGKRRLRLNPKVSQSRLDARTEEIFQEFKTSRWLEYLEEFYDLETSQTFGYNWRIEQELHDKAGERKGVSGDESGKGSGSGSGALGKGTRSSSGEHEKGSEPRGGVNGKGLGPSVGASGKSISHGELQKHEMC